MDEVKGKGGERLLGLLKEAFEASMTSFATLVGHALQRRDPERVYKLAAGEFSKVEKDLVGILDLAAEGEDKTADGTYIAIGIPMDGAVSLAETLLMMPASSIRGRLGTAALNDVEADSFGEVCNVFSGAIEQVFRARLGPRVKFKHSNKPRFVEPETDPFLETELYYSVGKLTLEDLPPFWVYLILTAKTAAQVAGPELLGTGPVAAETKDAATEGTVDGKANGGERAGCGEENPVFRPPPRRVVWWGDLPPDDAARDLETVFDLVHIEDSRDLRRVLGKNPGPTVMLVAVPSEGSGARRRVDQEVYKQARSSGVPILAILERPTRSAVMETVRAGATSILAKSAPAVLIRERIDHLLAEPAC